MPPALAPRIRHSTRRQWLLLVCVFVLSLPAVTPRIYSSDEIQYFAYLRSLWFDHDLSFENEYQYFYDRGIAKSDGFHETFLERTHRDRPAASTSARSAARSCGRRSTAPATSSRARPARRCDGFSKPYVAAVAYGSAVYGFLALVLAILCAQRLGLRRLRAGAGRLAGDAAPLLYVRRAAVLARLLGVRRGAVDLRLAAASATTGRSAA